jgi:hypothetical protein
VPSGWTMAGMLWHLGGVEHHWLQHDYGPSGRKGIALRDPVPDPVDLDGLSEDGGRVSAVGLARPAGAGSFDDQAPGGLAGRAAGSAVVATQPADCRTVVNWRVSRSARGSTGR